MVLHPMQMVFITTLLIRINSISFNIRNLKFSGRKVDAIIYELGVRDFTISKTSKAINKGLYDGLREDLENEGINYIKDLGVTHIQLMPVYDFEGTDEIKKTFIITGAITPANIMYQKDGFPKSQTTHMKELMNLESSLMLIMKQAFELIWMLSIIMFIIC